MEQFKCYLKVIIFTQHGFVKHLFLVHFLCFSDSLPSSMTCNIDMLSDFFSTKNNEESDWFLDDYNNVMVNEIKNTFNNFGNYKFHLLSHNLCLLLFINKIHNFFCRNR